MQKKNLWGTIPDIDSIRTPQEILQEQGEYLGEHTVGLLDFEIERGQKNTIFSYEVSIRITSLNVRQPLLRVTHDIKLYPAILHHEQSGEEYTAKGQDEFEEDLKSILSSKDTITLLRGLLAQAKLEATLAQKNHIGA